MAINNNSEDGRILRSFYPLITFPSEAFKDLCTNVNVETVQDVAVFKRGDTETELVYLLSGSVTLQSDGLVVEVIQSGSESAKFALAHQIPRKIDAVANGMVRIVRLNAHEVNNPPPAVYKEDLGYTVVESTDEDPDDWMTSVLRFPVFEALPATSLQKILISLRINQVKEGDTILENGSNVEHFYIVYKGQCLLTRNRGEEISEIKLNAGDSFGDEYVITDMPALETIIALTDTSVIQLEKSLFLSHIKKPSLRYINADEIASAQGKGSVVLDVRLPHHFDNYNLPDSANIPLLSLRMRLSEIPKDRQIIVVCANGRLSKAAAYLLTKQGFDAVVLRNGMGIQEVAENNNNGQHENQDGLPQSTQPAPESKAEIKDSEPDINTTEVPTSIPPDYESLTQRNRELEEANARLQAEKIDLEQQCLALSQQLERLKEITNRLAKLK
ncbi:MAG: cyclic nucleotide-binding domain-containing protein [Gammaproteobacteria bacterium]|nr:cyclic nucleotide-binding domain-containing protein [Gammaproteobacteria bacterium]